MPWPSGLQATHSGFGIVSQENVFKVCDQPHPLLIAKIVESCLASQIDCVLPDESFTFSCTICSVRKPELLLLSAAIHT